MHRGGQSRDRDARCRAGNLDGVGPTGAVDDHGIRRTVAHTAAWNTGKVEIDLGDVGAGQVVDGDGVGAAAGGEVDPLDAVEIHRDVGHIASEENAAAVGGNVDLLVDVCAVELHGVEAVLAFDGVAAVAGVPDEGIVAGAHEGHVIASAAVDEVVAIAADQVVVPGTSGDLVVARPTVHGQLNHIRGQTHGADRVISAERFENERVIGALGAFDRHEVWQAGDDISWNPHR